MTDKIIEKRTCTKTGKEFFITENDAKFYKKMSPKFGEYTAEIPFPTLCPEERQKRRLSFRNERKLYRRICDATKQPIISMYSPDKSYKVFDQKTWRGDSRDPMDYGMGFDFGKTFMEQFENLMKSVPKMALVNFSSENSEYTNWANGNKSCYLSFMTSHSEDSMYSSLVQQSKYCIDCTTGIRSEHCYECYNVEGCSHVFYSRNSSDCSFSRYLDDCLGCTDCFACNNLKNKQYCVLNKQYTKEEYKAAKELATLAMIQSFKEELIETPTVVGCEECTGSRLKSCKNCKECINGFYAEDCKFCLNFGYINDAYDCTALGYKSSLCYESIAGEEQHNTAFDFACLGVTDIYYSINCANGSSHLFGCDGLRNKSYCIFNKQYTKEEYNKLVPKIIEHMKTTGERGEFFDPSLSPFGYNETAAMEYAPLSREESIKNGFKRSDYESPAPQSTNVIEGSELPDSIEQIPDDIVKYAIRCKVTGKLFKIQPQELAFYRKHNIPLPGKHPDQRHLERLALRQ